MGWPCWHHCMHARSLVFPTDFWKQLWIFSIEAPIRNGKFIVSNLWEPWSSSQGWWNYEQWLATTWLLIQKSSWFAYCSGLGGCHSMQSHKQVSTFWRPTLPSSVGQMEAVCISTMLVTMHQTTKHCISEHYRFQTFGLNLKLTLHLVLVEGSS